MPIPIEDAYPLSHLQAGMLFHSEFAPESAVYHDVISYHIALPYDEKAAQQAIEQVVERHEVLRTSIDMTRFSEPLQIVYRKVQMPVRTEDLREMEKGQQKRRLSEWLEEEKRRGFEWGEAPLLRIYVHWLSNESFQWSLSFHHAILDGWSEASLMTELLQRYQRLCRGEMPLVEKLHVRYRDYVALERQAIESEESRNFWELLLAGYSSTPGPFSEPQNNPESNSILGRRAIELNEREWAELRELAASLRVPLKTVLLAAHLKTLSLLSGSSDVITGVVMNGRPEVQGGERMLGLFLNVVPVRLKIVLGSWIDLIRATLVVEQRIMPHRWYPMAMLKRSHGGGRELFETAFTYLNFHVYKQLRGNGQNVIVQRGGFARQSFPVQAAFEVTPGVESIRSFVEYSLDRVRQTDGERIPAYYAQVLRSMIDSPADLHSAGTCLSDAERRQILEKWNQTETENEMAAGVPGMFAAQVKRTPHLPAILFDEQQLSYTELDCQSNQLARYLRKMGVRSEVQVGICMDRSVEMMVALFGILKSGGAFVPLDPQYPVERLGYTIANARIQVVVTQRMFAAKLAQHQIQLLQIDVSCAQIEMETREPLDMVIEPENLAYVIYTSGSTGLPKGVMVSHRGMSNYLAEAARYLSEDIDGAVVSSPLSFDATLTTLLAPLLVGKPVELLPEDETTMGRLAERLFGEERTWLFKITPAYLAALEDVQRPREVGRGRHRIVLGGEQLGVETVARWKRELLPNAVFVNEYGPTETVVGCSAWTLSDEKELEGLVVAPIGRPIRNMQVYVLDEWMEPAPVGVAGELYIGGAGVARGYINAGALTAEKFLPDPHGARAGARCYRTGDRARWTSAGELEFLGRLDQQVKIRGFRIELREIEILLESHPGVKEAVVVAREGPGGEKQLVGYLVGHEGEELQVGQVREYLRGKLPGYMVPGVIVMLEKLPLTANGKVDPRKLPDPQEAGVRSGLQCEYEGPRTAVEEIVCGIWEEVLQVQQVGIHDNFFERGGHSLSATRLVFRVRRSLQVDLPLRRLFENPTVAGMARAIAAGKQVGGLVRAIERVSRQTPLPLSYAQRRLWFIDQLEPGSVAYNMSAAVPLEGELCVEALQRAVQTIVQRHETLRTHFARVGGEPVQVIDDRAGVQVEVEDLCGMKAEERDAVIQRLILVDARRPFDLSQGPLLRVKVLQAGERENVLLLSMHHIVSDGWSIEIFLRELSVLYKAYRAGEEAKLRELPLQYADFSVWQREWLEGGALEEQLGYWRKQLQGTTGVLNLRTDFRRPPVKGVDGRELRFVADSDCLAGLRKLSREAGTTLFMTLLACVHALMWRYSGQMDISIGTPIAGRNREEVEGLIGFFVNMLVMRMDVRGEESLDSHLRRLREMALAAYEHQDVPFEKLVEELRLERDPSRTPLFQVTFALENAGAAGLELHGLKTGAATRGVTVSNYDLSIEAHEFAKGLVLVLRYDTGLFAPETVERMGLHLQELLGRAARNCKGRIAELTRISDRERQQVLEDWNSTAFEYERRKCVHEVFEEQAERHPSAVAVVYEGQQLTYGQLNSRANQLANYLRKSGVKTETLVALFVERGLEMVVGLLGILKAGGAYVPIDPTSPSERLRYVLEDASVPLVLTEASLRERLPDSAAHVICINREWGEIEKESAEAPAKLALPGSLIYLIYTSGSTGKPKGVMVEHQSVMNHMAWMLHEFPLAPSARLLQKTSLSFDASFWELFAPWMTGARSVLLQPGKQDADVILRTIRSEGITRLQFIPSALKVLMGCLGFEEQTDSLLQVFCGGEILTPEITGEFFQRRSMDLHNIYGPTETAIISTFFRISSANKYSSSIPIGKPIANTQLYVLDHEFEPLPVGVAGELYIGGEGVARGYANRPDLSAEKFIPNPFSTRPGARLYRVGDLVRYLADGNVEFLGRLDNQVKIRGFRVELGEIESAILENPAVENAVMTIQERSAGNQQLVAYVVARDRRKGVDLNALRLILAESLPDYMVPKTYMVLDEMPLNANGKVDFTKLPVAEDFDASKSSYAAPQTKIEQTLCEIWAEVLDVEQIGVHDNFFELGGHSMLATYAQQRVRKMLQVEMPVRTFFDSPTVASFAEKIKAKLRETPG